MATPLLEVVAVATINSVTDNLFTKNIDLPAAFETPLRLASTFGFGSPTFAVSADISRTSQEITGDLSFGPIKLPVTIPFEFPAPEEAFLKTVEAAGFSVEVSVDAKLVA